MQFPYFITEFFSLTYRVICIGLLTNENLVPDHDIFWVTAFGIIKKIITGVDYKGVREIMKVSGEQLGCDFNSEAGSNFNDFC